MNIRLHFNAAVKALLDSCWSIGARHSERVKLVDTTNMEIWAVSALGREKRSTVGWPQLV